jgi:hypothetical protein
MYSQCLIFFILIILSHENRTNKPIELHIGALFDSEYPSIDNNRQDFQAAQLAIDEINSRHNELFNGSYTLKLLSNHSRVYTKNRFHFLYMFIINLFSVIRYMLLMLFFIQYFVVHKFIFLLEHHVQMKRKLFFKLLIITI